MHAYMRWTCVSTDILASHSLWWYVWCVQKNVVRIYLKCSVREQALRFIQREMNPKHLKPQTTSPRASSKPSSAVSTAATVNVGEEWSARIREALPPNVVYRTLHDVADDITKLFPNHHTELSDVLKRFVDNENRDDDDRKRYALIYGLSAEMDYRNTALYDIVIDTSNNKPADTYKQSTHISPHAFSHCTSHRIASHRVVPHQHCSLQWCAVCVLCVQRLRRINSGWLLTHPNNNDLRLGGNYYHCYF